LTGGKEKGWVFPQLGSSGKEKPGEGDGGKSEYHEKKEFGWQGGQEEGEKGSWWYRGPGKRGLETRRGKRGGVQKKGVSLKNRERWGTPGKLHWGVVTLPKRKPMMERT